MSLIIDCFEIEQPIGKMYVGYIPYDKLIKVIDVNERKYDSKLEQYIGIQRRRSEKRLAEIGKFITSPDSTFPTSVVLHLESKNILSPYNKKDKTIEITDRFDSLQVLDGQHRLYSFLKKTPTGLYDLPVTIIIDADIEMQAHVFTKINLNQTRVNKSLTYDLFEYTKTMSPQKFVHEVVKSLNKNEGPFYNKIKMIGIATNSIEDEIITQASIFEAVMRYISKKPEDELNYIKKHGFDKYRKTVKEDDSLLFQEEFLNSDYKTVAQFFYDYFYLVSKKWNNAWGKRSFILTKTTGVVSFIEALRRYMIVNIDEKHNMITFDYLNNLVNLINIEEKDFINDKYTSGGVGQRDLRKRILSCWGIEQK